MSTITVSTEVEVDLSEISDEDLAEECESRGLPGHHDIEEDVRAMYYAFLFGKEDAAMALARKIAQDVTGRILP